VIPVVFFISFLVSLFLPIISKLILLLIPIILHWGMKGLEKRAEVEEIHEHKIAAEGKTAHTIKQIS